ncbi:hypothetical protein CPAV1605_1283 [seawater metagenome]|uniref:F-box domain-containing protein n=1 Tax=seawater metagenome TaxID=1561972 RepID=A0A5E8CM91_9ZZZZ
MSNDLPITKVLNCYELLNTILSHMNNFDDFIRTRLVNKIFNKVVTDYLSKSVNNSNILSGKGTFIPINYCWYCNKSNDLTQINYCQDYHPRRIIIVCKNKICMKIAYTSYLQESLNIDKLIILSKPILIKECIIPRSNGTFNQATINQDYLAIIDNKIHIKVDFKENDNIYIKCCPIIKLWEINKGAVKEQFADLILDIKKNGIRYLPFFNKIDTIKIQNYVQNLIDDSNEKNLFI